MELKKVKICDLVPYFNNPRINDNAVAAVAESIKQCGYIAPIIVDEEMVILAGHTRTIAAKSLGYDEIEVIIKSGLTEDQKRKYRILDNKTNEFAEWDFDLLEKELEGLDFEGFDFGFGSEPENFDELDLDADEEEETTIIKFKFDRFADYHKYENEFKQLADKSGSKMSVSKE